METFTTIIRPQRWDQPFDSNMTDADVKRLTGVKEIAAIQADKFPKSTTLEGILKNDTAIRRFKPGDIVVRAGDYGSSAFMVLSGKVRVVLTPPLSSEKLGRQPVRKKGFFEALAQLWRNHALPEVRDLKVYQRKGVRKGSDEASTKVFLQDVPAVLSKHKTATMGPGAVFGELAALGRVPRTATIFAESDAELLEIRWQGLRELRKYDEGWKRQIDHQYRQNALRSHLGECAIFKGLPPEVLQKVADETLFETYGSFDWNVSYKKMRSQQKAAEEPVIAKEGDYPDGLLMVRAGFARVSVRMGTGERTLTYLGAGDTFGMDELYEGWKGKKDVSLQTSLTALGYVDLLRIPGTILDQYVFQHIEPPKTKLTDFSARHLADDGLLEWAVEERLINARQAMLIDLDKCVRCDDCVRACGSTHGGNPRFRRQGKTFDHWMVTNACMHCSDPVCMIGCPTGAIHRTPSGGEVVINDNTCVGCATCANSCPYENIQMVEISDMNGLPVLDPDNAKPIMKATKCDLCFDQLGGPACVRACPHDALSRTNFHTIARSYKASK